MVRAESFTEIPQSPGNTGPGDLTIVLSCSRKVLVLECTHSRLLGPSTGVDENREYGGAGREDGGLTKTPFSLESFPVPFRPPY